MKLEKIDGIYRSINNKKYIIPISNQMTKKGMFFEINDIGEFIWKAIEKNNEIDTDSVIKMVSKEYDIEESIVKTDIELFIQELVKRQLVKAVI